jgi:hypothetical protein
LLHNERFKHDSQGFGTHLPSSTLFRNLRNNGITRSSNHVNLDINPYTFNEFFSKPISQVDSSETVVPSAVNPLWMDDNGFVFVNVSEMDVELVCREI